MPLAILLACLNGSENVNADLEAGLFSVYFRIGMVYISF